MEKVEKYIQEYTNKCSNELGRVTHKNGNVETSYHEWLSPDQARGVAEIARKEAINDALKVIRRLEKEAYNNYNDSLTKWLGNELNIEEKENYRFWAGVIRACNEITSKIKIK